MRITTNLFALALVAACNAPADDTDDTDDTDVVDTDETDDTDETVTSACEDFASAPTGTICTIAGRPKIRALGYEDVLATESELSLPIDITFDASGRIHVIDWNNHRLRRIDADGTIHTYAGTGFLGDGPEGPAVDAAFNHPTDLDFHPNDDTQLYVSAWHNSRINVVDTVTGDCRFEAGTGGRAYGGDDGPAAAAVFDLPSSVVFEDDGSYYISDQASQIIRKVALDGTVTTVAGAHPIPNPEPPEGCAPPCHMRQPGWEGDGGPALEAKFRWSTNQAAFPGSRMERFGRILYVADSLNHVVRKIDLETMIIDHVAGTGTVAGFSGDGGPAAEAKLDTPADVAVGPDGTLYIADTENHCVRAVDGDGNITTVAGVCTEPGYSGEGGLATAAHLFHPYGIEVSADGTTLVIADTENEILRAVRL